VLIRTDDEFGCSGTITRLLESGTESIIRFWVLVENSVVHGLPSEMTDDPIVEPVDDEPQGVPEKTGNPTSRVVSNSVWNVAAFIFSAVLLFISTPILLSSLGTDMYGLVVLLSALLAPLGLTNLNFSLATIKYVAEESSRGDLSEAAIYVETTLLFNIGIGFFGGVVLALLGPWLVNDVFNIAFADRALAISSLYWIAVGWGITQVSMTFSAVPVALQRFDWFSVGTIIFSLLYTGFGLGMVIAGHGVLGLVQGQFIAQLFGLLGWYLLARRLLPTIGMQLRWHPTAFRRSFRFGFWQTIGQIGSLIAGQADKYILGIVLTPAAVGLYNVALSVEGRVYSLGFKMAEVLFPAFSSLQGLGDKRREGTLFVQSSWLLTTLSTCALASLMVWSNEFLTLWLGGNVAKDVSSVLQVLTLAGILGSASNAGYFYLLGLGKTHVTATLAIVTGGIVLIGSIILVPQLGLAGAGWSNVAAMLAQAVVISIVVGMQFKQQMRPAIYLSAMYGPIVTGLIVAGFVILAKSAVSPIINWAFLIAGASLTSALIFCAIVIVDRFLPGGHTRRESILQLGRRLTAEVYRFRSAMYPASR
jgi:O-antigen/teichoic acid export membrane protein